MANIRGDALRDANVLFTTSLCPPHHTSLQKRYTLCAAQLPWVWRGVWRATTTVYQSPFPFVKRNPFRFFFLTSPRLDALHRFRQSVPAHSTPVSMLHASRRAKSSKLTLESRSISEPSHQSGGRQAVSSQCSARRATYLRRLLLTLMLLTP